MTSYTASYSHITNKGRAFYFNTTALGYLDFKKSTTTALFWKTQQIMELSIISKPNFKELAGSVSKKIGTMKALPEWILDGAVVGLQGGQDFINSTYIQMKDAGLKMSALWMQDWVGTHSYPEGDRLQWNWQLNLDQYPDWPQLVKGWSDDGVKPMIYLNPYFTNLTGSPNLREN